MPDLDPVQQDQLNERSGTNAHVLLWIEARNRTTGLPETMGLWTGDDHQDFLIDGAPRTYLGAGNVIQVAPIRTTIGLRVRTHRITLPPVTDEVRLLLRGYEPRQAKVEVHVCRLNIYSGAPLGTPKRMIKGTLNKAPERLGKKNDPGKLELEIASNAQRLTIGVPLMRSDEELRRRAANDRGREYVDVIGDWVIPWG